MVPEPKGKLKVFEAPVRLAANVLFIGPLMKEVVLPPITVPVFVLRCDNILLVEVVSMPLVSVKVPLVLVACESVTILVDAVPVFAIVRFPVKEAGKAVPVI